MNILRRINEFVERSKHLSHMEWFPYSKPHSTMIANINTALRSAPSEKERWGLFCGLLSLWGTRRDTKITRMIFGAESPWKYKRPLVLSSVFFDSSEETSISLFCAQPLVCRIIGQQKLLARYHRCVLRSGHVITLEEFNSRFVV